MFRTLISLALFSLIIVGCATKRVSSVDPDARARIGYAATAHYPGNPQAATTSVMAAAIDHPRDEQIEIINLSDNAIPSPTIWVNGAYLRQLTTLPPRGDVIIAYDGLLQGGNTASDFKRAQQPVTKVELQTGGALYTVLGPAVKH
jgi:hypothetical protein